MEVGVSIGREVSNGETISEGRAGVSVEEIASGGRDEQEAMRRKKKNERRMRVAVLFCMDGF